MRRASKKLQRDSGLDPETVEKIDHIFRCDIAGCARSIGTSAQAPGRAVEYREPHLKRLIDVRDGHSISIVKMHCESGSRELLKQAAGCDLNVPRSRCADSIA